MNIINPLVSEYLDRFYLPVNDAMADLRNYAEERYIPIITKDVERFLAVLLQDKRPCSILEIGTAIGYSASFMAITWAECQIDTIEINHQTYEAAMRNFTKMGLLHRVRALQGDAGEIMAKFIDHPQHANGLGYDFIFIDASKSKYMSFFKQAMKLLKPGGLIVCDNVLMRGTVANDCYDPDGKHKTSVKNIRAFLTYITTLETVETAILPIGDGISMSIKKI